MAKIAARLTDTKFDMTLGWGQPLPGPCTLESNQNLRIEWPKWTSKDLVLPLYKVTNYVDPIILHIESKEVVLNESTHVRMLPKILKITNKLEKSVQNFYHTIKFHHSHFRSWVWQIKIQRAKSMAPIRRHLCPTHTPATIHLYKTINHSPLATNSETITTIKKWGGRPRVEKFLGSWISSLDLN